MQCGSILSELSYQDIRFLTAGRKVTNNAFQASSALLLTSISMSDTSPRFLSNLSSIIIIIVIIIIIIPWRNSLLRAGAYQPTQGLTFTCPQTSLRATYGQHIESPSHRQSHIIIIIILLFIYKVSIFSHFSDPKNLFFFSVLPCRSIPCCQFPSHSFQLLLTASTNFEVFPSSSTRTHSKSF